MEILEQMRQAREELGLDLHALEHRTRVRLHLLEAVEQGRFEDLPRGVYARAVVRAYATAVGMDPNRVVTAVALGGGGDTGAGPAGATTSARWPSPPS